jgi:hypothetical protein
MNKKMYQSPEAEIEKFKVNCDEVTSSGTDTGIEEAENNFVF